jgi:glycosyltransferase involved in cell wall biosynthesis
MMPRVSVILPTYNRLRFLKPAVESVLQQSLGDWELIVADDGSSDDTRTYLKSLISERVRVVWLAHSGNPSRVRNAALAKARGEYLAFLDSDDVWAPDKLQRQLAALRTHPTARWCYCACAPIDAQGEELPKKNLHEIVRPQGYIFEQLLKLQIGIAMPTVLAERTLIEEVGGFDEALRFGEFHDLCLRMALRGETVGLDDNLCWVRSHDEHYSSDRINDQAAWMQLYEKMSHLAKAPRLANYSAKMRALTSLKLAREYALAGKPRQASRTLAAALPFSWSFPGWWWGVLKGAALLATRRQG